MRFLIPVFISLGIWGGAFTVKANTTITKLTATIVASSCIGEIITTSPSVNGINIIDFGVVNPKLESMPKRNFSLRLMEQLGGEIGCSAFKVYGRQYSVATISFGDLSNSQLDENGVIMRNDEGLNSSVRVHVTPLDSQAKFPFSGSLGYVTATHSEINYPVEFAAQGLFNFQATLAFIDKVKSGRFSGTLTITLIYR